MFLRTMGRGERSMRDYNYGDGDGDGDGDGTARDTWTTTKKRFRVTDPFFQPPLPSRDSEHQHTDKHRLRDGIPDDNRIGADHRDGFLNGQSKSRLTSAQNSPLCGARAASNGQISRHNRGKDITGQTLRGKTSGQTPRGAGFSGQTPRGQNTGQTPRGQNTGQTPRDALVVEKTKSARTLTIAGPLRVDGPRRYVDLCMYVCMYV